jgi:hypothetical protein
LPWVWSAFRHPENVSPDGSILQASCLRSPMDQTHCFFHPARHDVAAILALA